MPWTDLDTLFGILRQCVTGEALAAFFDGIFVDVRQELANIVHSELISLLGPVDSSLHLKQDGPTIIMLCGLQGSGKTTTCGKLSQLLKEENIKPMLVAADLQRPAAIEQLQKRAQAAGVIP